MKEQRRGCGQRKIGGLYLIGHGLAVPCDRLPYELTACPTCGGGIHFSRGYQLIDWTKYAGQHKQCEDYFPTPCPICEPAGDSYALMWVGDKYYSPATFIREAERMGVSKRISMIPKGITIGKTWILLAHKKAITRMVPDLESKNTGLDGEHPLKPEGFSAVFYAFRPTKIEKILNKTQSKDRKLVAKLKRQGITPLVATKWDRKTGDVLETEAI